MNFFSLFTYLGFKLPASAITTNLLGAIILATVSFSVWGAHLSQQLDQNWTEDQAWRVHNRQIGMFTVWIALVWVLIVVELVK